MGKNKKRKNRNKRSGELKPVQKSSNLNTIILATMTVIGAALVVFLYSR